MVAAVGTCVGATTANGNNATFTIASNITVGAGDSFLVAGIGSTNSSSVLSVSGGGLTYTQVGSTLTDTADHDHMIVWSVTNPGAGTYTVTVALSATPASPYPGIAIIPLTGCVTSSLVVANGPGQFQTAPGTGTSAVTSGTAQTPSSFPCLAVGICSDDDLGATPLVDTGWTDNGSFWAWEIGTNGLRIVSKRITSGTVQATFTSGTGGGSDHYLTHMVVVAELASTANDNSGKSSGRQLLEGFLPHMRMSPRSENEAQTFLRAQKRAYGFAAAA